MNKKIFVLIFGVVLLVSTFGFVAAANGNNLLQIWRNVTTSANVSWVDFDGNWFMNGDLNVSGIIYGDGSGLTGIGGNFNSTAWNSTGDKVFLSNTSAYVGIGTSSPGVKLEIAQSADDAGLKLIGYDDVNSEFAHMYMDGAGYFNINAPDVWRLRVNDNSVVYIQSTHMSLYDNKILGLGTGLDFQLKYDATTDDRLELSDGTNMFLTVNDTGTTADFDFNAGDLFIKNDGNVGIGTTSPGAKLDVQYGGYGYVAQLIQTSGVLGGANGLLVTSDAESSDTALAVRTSQTPGSTTEADTKFIVTGTGNVGIGTTSPQNELNVIGDINATGTINATTDVCIEGGNCLSSVSGSGGNSTAWNRSGTNVFLANTGDNVGIGTTTPQNELNVIGNLNVTGTSGTTEDIVSFYSGSGIETHVFSSNYGYGSLAIRNMSDTDHIKLDAGGISYVLGKWGVGTTNPSNKLQVAGGDIGLDWDKSLVFPGGTKYSQNEIYFGSSDFTFEGWDGSLQEVMRLTPDGNVGIGTTSPLQKLHVNGNILANGTINATTDVCIEGGNCLSTISASGLGAVTGSGTSGYLSRWNGTMSLNNSVIYQSGSNVGIGTTSPSTLLDIREQSGDAIITLGRISTGITQDQSLGSVKWWNPDANGDGPTYVGMIDVLTAESTGAGGYMVFLTHDGSEGGEGSSPVERMRISSSGNVGIGTTSPQGKLHVDGNAVFNGTVNMDSNKIISLANGTTAQDAVTYSQLQAVNGTMSGDYVPYTGSTKAVELGGYDFSVNNSDLFVDVSTGRVGIGTTSPFLALNVYHATNNALAQFESGDANAFIDFKDSETTDNYKVMAGAVSDDFVIYSGGSERVRIDSDGNVGIGTTSPQNELNVIGDLNVTGTIYSENGQPISSAYSVSYQPAYRVSNDASSRHELRIPWPSTASGPIILDVEVLVDTDSVGTKHYSKQRFYLTSYVAKNPGELYSQSSYLVDSMDGSSAVYNYINPTFVENATTGEIVLSIYSGSSQNRANSVKLTAWGTEDVANLILNSTYTSNVETGITPPARAAVQAPPLDNFKVEQNLIMTDEGYIGIGDSEERINFDSGGDIEIMDAKVGIGTTSPYEKLNVMRTGAGDIARFADDSSTKGLIIAIDASGNPILKGTSSNQPMTISPDGYLAFETDGIERMRILQSSGNVGIGTTSPGAKLDVQYGGYGYVAQLIQTSGVLGGANGLLVTSDAESSDTALAVRTSQTPGSTTEADTKFIVTGTGNVGIGTTSPSYKLDVAGDVNAYNLLINGTPVGTGSINSNGTANYVSKFVNSSYVTSSAIYESGGNVGIGKTSPTSKLHIDGGSGFNANAVYIKGGYNQAASLALESAYAGDAPNLYFTGYNILKFNNATNSFRITAGTGAGTGTEYFRISQTGNVGIGTTSPSEKLHLYSSTDDVNLELEADGSDNVALILNRGSAVRRAETQYHTLDSLSWMTGIAYNGGATSNNFQIGTGSTVSDAKVTITTTGKVGIGTSSPVTTLDIVSTGANGIVLNNDLGATSDSARLFFEGNTQTYNIMNDDGKLSFRSGATVGSGSGTAKMTMDSDGNVGIGTTSPLQKLHVNGNILANGTINATTDVCIEGGNCLSSVSGSGVSNSTAWNRSGTNVFLANTGDNVGIGTDSSSYKLDVSGDINLPEANAYKIGGTDVVKVNWAQDSIAVGSAADTTKQHILAIGEYAGVGATGDAFLAQGYYAGYGAGDNFFAQGYYAGSGAGNNFVAQGMSAGYDAGNNFVAQGSSAGYMAGDNFVAQGMNAGYRAGDRFIALGYESTRTDTLSSPTDIDDSIALGYQSDPRFDGHFLIKQANLNSDPLIQGDLNSGKVMIGAPTATSTGDFDYMLDVTGNASFSGNVTTQSDFCIEGGNCLSTVGGISNSVAWNRSGTNVYLSNTEDNVGIGTTSPSRALEVNASTGDSPARFSSDDAGSAIEIKDPTGIAYVGSTAGYHFFGNSSVYNGAGNIVIPQSTGYVGIGTTSPIGKLEVDSLQSSTVFTGTSAAIYASNSDQTNNNYVRLNFGDGDSNAASSMASQITDHANNYGNLEFWTRGSDGFSNKMIIEENGNVGIGTTSPSGSLEVHKSSGNTYLDIDTDGNYDSVLRFKEGGTDRWKFYTDGNSHVDDFYIENEDSNKIITIKQDNEYVGIGTTAPSAKLTVETTLGGEQDLLEVFQPYNSRYTFIGDADLDALHLYTSSVGYIMTFEKGGDIGIGTKTPVDTLNVVGTANFTGDVTTQSDFCIEGGDCLSTVGGISNSVAWNRSGTNVYLSNTDDNVGIGTTSPNFKLDVNGSILSSGTIGGSNFRANDSFGTFVGVDAGLQNTGDYVDALGYQSAYDNNGGFSSFIGYQAGYQNEGEFSSFIGYKAGYQNSISDFLSGNYVSAIGYQAAYQNKENYVSAIGYQAGYQNEGNYVDFIGHLAGYQNKGEKVVYIGTQAGEYAQGNRSIALGYFSGVSSRGNESVMIGGSFTGSQNTGNNLISIGSYAGYNNTGDNVIAFGYEAGMDNREDNKFIVKQNNVNTTALIQGDFATGQVNASDFCTYGGNCLSSVSGGSGSVSDVWVNESGDTMSGNLSLGGNFLTNVGTLSFSSGANHKISSSGSGLLFDGGDGNWDFLIYDNTLYMDKLITGYTGAANITTYDSNEDLTIDPSGTGNILLNPDGVSYVGIGLANPSNRLTVKGDVNITGTSASLYINGSLYFSTTGNGTTSDADWAWVPQGENLYLLEPENANKQYIGIYDDNFIGIGVGEDVLKVDDKNVEITGNLTLSTRETFSTPQRKGFSSYGTPSKDIVQDIWINTGGTNVACVWEGSSCEQPAESPANYPTESCGSYGSDFADVSIIGNETEYIEVNNCASYGIQGACEGAVGRRFMTHTYCKGWTLE